MKYKNLTQLSEKEEGCIVLLGVWYPETDFIIRIINIIIII